MADDATTTAAPATPEATAAPSTTATPPAGAQNTETTAEVMIPKSRLDEVLAKLKSFESDKTKAEKAAKDAENASLAEQGKYKEIADRATAELAAAQQAAKAAEMRLLQRDVAAKTSLPLPLADRLRGETEEEMIADAKAIIAALPKPAAPNINANSGAGGAPAPGALDDAEKKRIADKYGVDSRYVQ